jgi:hypothetical protein
LISLRRQGVKFAIVKCGIVECGVERKPVEVAKPPVPPPDAAQLEVWVRANLPPAVRLLAWDLKPAPVAIDRCSAVIDPPKFVAHVLEELRIALEFPRRQVGWTVRELVEQLETVGVKLSLDSHPLSKGNEVWEP